MTDSPFSLSGRTALITGGGGGIGGAIARHMAKAGARVIAADINLAAAEAVAADCGAGALALQVDLLDPASIAAMFDAVQEKAGRLDIFVASAGLSDRGDIFDLTLEEWQQIIGVNLTGSFLCAKHAAPIMRDAGWGRMIFIGSPTGFRGALRGHAAYASSKGGLFSLAKTLARTLAPWGITANVLTPGQTDTELLWRTNPREAMDKIVASVPLGLAKPEHVSAGAVFLASEAAGHITGVSLDIDGGGVMR